MLGVYCGVEVSFSDCVSAFVQGWMAYMSGIVSRVRVGDGDGGSEVGAVEMYTVLKSCIGELNVIVCSLQSGVDGVTGMFGQGL